MNKTRLTLFSCLLASQVALMPLASAEELRIDVEHYNVIGESHLSEAQLSTLLEPYTGNNKTLDDLQQAATALQNKLRDIGYGFYQVELAAQTLDSKEVTLTIESIVIHDINVEHSDADKQYFSQENIRHSLPSLKKGTSPNLHKISSELEMANLNPSKNATVQFAMSPQSNEIDADIIVNEQNPQDIYAWFNNTGSKDTGDYRLGVGYTHHNLFDKDHELRLTFTTSPNHASDVQQYGIDYRIPFYEYRGIWNLYAYYSDVDSGTVAGGFDVAGKGTFIGTRYEWYLPKLTNQSKYAHHLVFGLEDKLFNNDVFFAKSALGTDVRSTPLSIAYYGRWEQLTHNLDFYLKYEHNLEFGSHNSKLAYTLSRYNATPNWDVFKFGANFDRPIGQYRLHASVNAQYSDQELISGEQFGMGGQTGGVRGFSEREIIADRGVTASLELWSPTLWNNQINAMAFTDYGYANRVNPLPNEQRSDSIMSLGIGAVWRWQQHVDLTVYLAHVTNGNDSDVTDDPTHSGDNAIHFNLFINY